jgi:hypothetical protein
MQPKQFKSILMPFILFYLFQSLPVQSQILNVEGHRMKSDSINQFYGNLKFRLHIHNRSATEDEKIRYHGITLASRFGYLSELHNYMLISDLKYNSVTGQPFIRTGYSHFRTNWFRENAISYESFTQVQFDLGRGMNLRWLAGSGIRFRLVQDDNIKLFLGSGGMFERERWEHPRLDDVMVVKNIPKWTNYLSYSQKFTQTMAFNLILYYQTGYDNDDDAWRQRFSLDSGLRFNISDKISFVMEFAWAYEAQPVVPIIKHIYSLENGIVIEF